MPAPHWRNCHRKNAPLNEGGWGKPPGEKNKQKQGSVWYSRRLVIYTAGGGPSGGIRKKRKEVACGNPRRLVVHAAGTSHGKEVGIGGTIRAPSLLIIAESLGKRPRRPLAHPRHPPAHPPLLTAAPIPLSLPSYTSFDLVTWRHWGHREPVTWRCWGASLGSLGAGVIGWTYHDHVTHRRHFLYVVRLALPLPPASSSQRPARGTSAYSILVMRVLFVL